MQERKRYWGGGWSQILEGNCSFFSMVDRYAFQTQAAEDKAKPKPVAFTITPETLAGVKEVSSVLSENLGNTQRMNPDLACSHG